MSIRTRYLKSRTTRARHVWENHAHKCACCASARTAATLCAVGQRLWLEIARKEIDLERAERENRIAEVLAGGVR